MLLGVRAQDWDLCTSALPEQVMEIFPGSRPTGLRHGTVTVKVSACSIRVKVWRESRTATMNTARCQMQPMVAQPMVMVFTASPALTVRKAPCLMRAIRASALSR